MAAEGSDQRFVFGMFFVTFLYAAQVSAESNFNEEQGAFAAANVCRWWVGGNLGCLWHRSSPGLPLYPRLSRLVVRRTGGPIPECNWVQRCTPGHGRWPLAGVVGLGCPQTHPHVAGVVVGLGLWRCPNSKSSQSLGSGCNTGGESGVERTAMRAPGVCVFVPASADTRRRVCGEWRVPPPLKAFRMAAWVSRHAALCLLMIWLLWAGHSPATWVHESWRPQSGHASDGAWPYLYASFPV